MSYCLDHFASIYSISHCQYLPILRFPGLYVYNAILQQLYPIYNEKMGCILT